MPFAPGKSGNPSGRPKVVAHIRDLARQHTDTAIKALVEEARSGTGSARVAAASALLDRAYGKAPSTLAGEDGEGNAGLEIIFKWQTDSSSAS